MIVERLLRFAHINVRRFLSFVSLRYHFVCNRSGMFAANRFSKLKFILLHALLWVASTLGNRWHSGRKTLLQLRWSSITSYVRQSQNFYFQFQCQQRSLWSSNHCRTTICVQAIKFLLSFYWRNAARKKLSLEVTGVLSTESPSEKLFARIAIRFSSIKSKNLSTPQMDLFPFKRFFNCSPHPLIARSGEGSMWEHGTIDTIRLPSLDMV